MIILDIFFLFVNVVILGFLFFEVMSFGVLGEGWYKLEW